MAITYLYRCSTCNIVISAVQSIKDEPFKTCFDDDCLGSLERIITGGSDILIKGEARTLGQQAERNQTKFGRFWREDKIAKHKLTEVQAKKLAREEFQKKLPAGVSIPDTSGFEGPQWYRKEDKPDLSLASLSSEAKTRYILEGKKPL